MTQKTAVFILKFEQYCFTMNRCTQKDENAMQIMYRKNPKYSDTQNICCNHAKIWTRWLYQRVMHPKDAARIANSVDPDQSLIWVCSVCPDLSVPKLRNIMVDHDQTALLVQTSPFKYFGPLWYLTRYYHQSIVILVWYIKICKVWFGQISVDKPSKSPLMKISMGG